MNRIANSVTLETNSLVFAKRRPFIFSILLIIIILGITLISINILPNLHAVREHYIKKSIRELFIAVVLSLIVTKLKWWKQIGFQKPANWKTLWIFAPCLIPLVIVLVGTLAGRINFDSVSTTVLIGVSVLLVGFVEEVAFRGLMLNALKPRGKWVAVLVTALLFCLVHAANILNGASLPSALQEMFGACVLGFGFAAMALRGIVLWPLIFAHALIDFFGDMPKTETANAGGSIGLLFLSFFIILVVYGVFLMLKGDALTVHSSGRS